MEIGKVYQKLEDKYYSILESVNSVFPILGIVDKIDRIIPSFLLVILLLFIVIAGGFFYLFSPALPGTGSSVDSILTISTFTEEGNPLAGVKVKIRVNNEPKFSEISNEFGKAIFTIPIDSNLMIIASKDGFIEMSDLILINKQKLELDFTMFEDVPLSINRTLILQDETGRILEGTNVRIDFQCSNEKTKSPENLNVSEGFLQIKEPRNCGALTATLIAKGYKQESIPLKDASQFAKLTKLPPSFGRINVIVNSEDGKLINNAIVQVFNSKSKDLEQASATLLGQVIFSNIPIGDYYIVVNDPTKNYAIFTSDEFKLLENETALIKPILSKGIQSTILINVLDRKTNQAIPSALVQLVENEKVIGRFNSDETGSVKINLMDFGEFKVIVTHEDYLHEIFSITANTKRVVLNASIEKLTNENSGRIIVVAKDEKGVPVSNTKVSIYDSETNLLIPQQIELYTNEDGIANLRGIASGEYYVRGYKFPIEGFSDSKEIQLQTENIFDVNMLVGRGIIRVSVENNSVPISNARVIMHSEFGEIIKEGETNLSGEIEFEGKLDRRVFFTIEKDNFLKYSTAFYRPLKSQKINVNVSLGKEINETRIEFLGFYSDSQLQNKVDSLKSAKRYYGLFKIFVPKKSDFAGIHVRSGEKNSATDEDMLISSLEVPFGNIIRGETYNPSRSEIDDLENLTNSYSKWAQAIVPIKDSGIIEARTEFVVRDSAIPNSLFTLRYRGFTIEKGAYLRDPFDSELGNSQFSSQKDSLYAKTKKETIFAGSKPDCKRDLCFIGANVYNSVLKRHETIKPFKVLIGSSSDIKFKIANFGEKSYENVKIIFKPLNESFSFFSTELILPNLEKKTIKGLNEIILDSFSPNEILDGTINFSLEEIGKSKMNVEIWSNDSLVSVNELEFEAGYLKFLDVLVEPKKFSPLTKIPVSVLVKDTDGGVISNVNILVSRILENGIVQNIGSFVTDFDGKANFIFPPSFPNSKMEIRIQSVGFAAAPIIRVVDDDILNATPSEIFVELMGVGDYQDVELEVGSKLDTTFTIEKAYLAGHFSLVDTGSIRSFLKNFVEGKKITQAKSNLKLLIAKLKNSVRRITSRTYEGAIVLILKTDSQKKKWVHAFPLTVQVGSPRGVDSQNCITLNNFEWDSFTVENETSLTFTLENKCKVNKKPVDLKDLQFLVEWSSGKEGMITINLEDLHNKEIYSDVLSDNNSVILVNRFRNDNVTEYFGKIIFSPKSGTLGKTARFKVKPYATILTDTGIEKVYANKDFVGDILIVNLSDCVKFEPEPQSKELILKREKESTNFFIDTTACGNLEIDVSFCNQGANQCRGDTKIGGVEISPSLVSLQNERKQIIVKRGESDIGGIYGITADVRPKGKTFQRLATLDAIIEPSSFAFFYLDKYELNMFGIGAKDSVTLTNTMVMEDVDITADMCVWEGQAKKEHHGAKLAGMGGGMLVIAAAILVFTSICPPCLIVGIIIASLIIIAGIVMEALGVGEKDCKDTQNTYTMQDYVMNLLDDTKKVSILERGGISSKWDNFGKIDAFDSVGDGKAKDFHQTRGLTFENTFIQPTEKPFYATLEVSANETIHGDSLHQNANVYCEEDDFSNFDIGRNTSCGPVQEKTYKQKFHVLVKPQEVEQYLPYVKYDTFACSRGTLVGRTGPGANPKVAWDWDWENISQNYCDSSNENFRYCDATQFSMMLTKRLHIFDEFLTANSYDLDCPKNPVQNSESEVNSGKKESNIVDGKIGVLRYEKIFNPIPNDLRVEIDLQNKSIYDANVQVKMTLSKFEGSEKSNDPAKNLECVKEKELLAISNDVVKCEFNNLEKGNHILKVEYSSESNNFFANDELSTIIVTDDPILPSANDGCWAPKTTFVSGDESGIMKYVRNNPHVIWTKDIKSANDLDKLLNFKAHLIRDSFTKDFRQDFVDYYTIQNFADTPVYFYSDKDGRNFDKYFLDDKKMIFLQKYFNEQKLPAPGLYNVSLGISFTGKNWDFFGKNSQIASEILVELYHLKDPYPNSPYYSLPLDGYVGFDGEKFERNGYGISFNNTDNKRIKFNEGLTPITSMQSEGSSLVTLHSKKAEDIETLNVKPKSRGQLAKIEVLFGDEKELIFSPNYATPVLMKVNNSEKSDESFSVFYSLTEDQERIETGGILATWEGAGVCKDFSNKPVFEVFNYTTDRHASSTDSIREDLTGLYATTWKEIKKPGSVFLRTIIYTPRNSNMVLSSIQPRENMLFYTPDKAGQTVLLQGIKTMKYNRKGNTDQDVIDSVVDLFNMVDQNLVCVTDRGVNVAYWWNPKAIYGEKGSSNESITTKVNQLHEKNECIS